MAYLVSFMDLFVLDDSAQKKPTREGMGPLVAVGGLYVPSASVRPLERVLDDLCQQTGFPRGDEFKWSPDRKMWMQKSLRGVDREEFFRRALSAAVEGGAKAIVVIEDTRHKRAVSQSISPEHDVVTMFLERANTHLRNVESEAIVVCDRPGGNRSSEHRFLSDCLEQLRNGTDYVDFESINLLLTSDSRLSRLLQLADVVTSATLAYVAGESNYSPAIWREIAPLMRKDGGRIGGKGVKIHPDLRYGNLYHWLFDDAHIRRGVGWVTLPDASIAYAATSDNP